MKTSAQYEAEIAANERQIRDREENYLEHLQKRCRCPKQHNFRCDGHKRACLAVIRQIKQANYKLGQQRLKAISEEKNHENASKVRGRKQPKLRKGSKVSSTSN